MGLLSERPGQRGVAGSACSACEVRLRKAFGVTFSAAKKRHFFDFIHVIFVGLQTASINSGKSVPGGHSRGPVLPFPLTPAVEGSPRPGAARSTTGKPTARGVRPPPSELLRRCRCWSRHNEPRRC